MGHGDGCPCCIAAIVIAGYEVNVNTIRVGRSRKGDMLTLFSTEDTIDKPLTLMEVFRYVVGICIEVVGGYDFGDNIHACFNLADRGKGECVAEGTSVFDIQNAMGGLGGVNVQGVNS